MVKGESASAILIDIGINMWYDERRDFDDAKQAIFQLVASQSKPNSFASLLALGSATTNNSLANNEEFRNIELLLDFFPTSLGWIRLASTLIIPGSLGADPVDGLIVGCQMLEDFASERDIKEKTIYLFTNGNSSLINPTGLHEIVAQFASTNARFFIVLCGPTPLIDSVANANIKSFNNIVESLQNGSKVMKLAEFKQECCTFIPKPVKGVSCMNGNLIVEPDEIEIPIQVYIKSTQASLPVPKKTNEKRNMATRTTEYFDVNDSPVDVEQVQVVFKIGNEFIKTDEILQVNDSSLSKGIHCIGFIDSNKISNHAFVGNTLEIFPDSNSDEKVAQQFVSFCQAMLQSHTHCLCHYIRHQKETPKFGILIPTQTNTQFHLYFEYLCHQEEIMNKNFKAVGRNCTKEQKETMLELIKELQLDELLLGRNPVFERFQKAIISKATKSLVQNNECPTKQRSLSQQTLHKINQHLQ